MAAPTQRKESHQSEIGYLNETVKPVTRLAYKNNDYDNVFDIDNEYEDDDFVIESKSNR